MFDDIPDSHRSGYISLVGKPNVGKSTLMNALLGQKLSIVTRKPQTTRHRIVGIHSGPEHQIIFQDTPGILKPEYGLQSAMMDQVTTAIRDADLLLFLADATRDTPDTLSLKHIEDRPALLVLTKMDLIPQEQALPLVETYMDLRGFEEVIPTSSITGFNLDVLLDTLREMLPQGPPFYPKDQISEHPQRFFVAELIREQILEYFHEEVPYSTQVNIVEYTERPDSKDFIDAEIVVTHKSHKGILIGKGGRALKRLGKAARRTIEAFLDTPVYLQLHVKVRKDWRDREQFLRSYGYRE